ncbi:hypothetical protein R3P38DRAFT_2766428 [Favolaschia claudopus]|uniref:Uncharacterized protein n=1 Tax=Favolaschia claudopus TaxID=2862362 RepID=A0AAW0D2F7_9AGAR
MPLPSPSHRDDTIYHIPIEDGDHPPSHYDHNDNDSKVQIIQIPLRSDTIHTNADRLIALFDSELSKTRASISASATETARLRAELADARRRETHLLSALEAAHAENGASRAQLGIAREESKRLLRVLGALGVTCTVKGEVLGYSKEWFGLVEALKEDEAGDDEAEAEEDGMEVDGPAEAKASSLDPLRILTRVRLLLESRQRKWRRWKAKYADLKERGPAKKPRITQ